jgi:hypothetical protein
LTFGGNFDHGIYLDTVGLVALSRCLGCWCEVGDACEGSGSFVKDALAVVRGRGMPVRDLGTSLTAKGGTQGKS